MKTIEKAKANIQKAIDNQSYTPYGVVTALMRNAFHCGLIDDKQLKEIDRNLSRLVAGSNEPVNRKQKPKHHGSCMYIHQQVFEDLNVGDTCFDGDYGQCMWDGKKWVQLEQSKTV